MVELLLAAIGLIALAVAGSGKAGPFEFGRDGRLGDGQRIALGLVALAVLAGVGITYAVQQGWLGGSGSGTQEQASRPTPHATTTGAGSATADPSEPQDVILSAGPRSTTRFGVKLTVQEVGIRGGKGYVRLRATNTSGETRGLTLGRFQVQDAAGRTHQADVFETEGWSDEVLAGSTLQADVLLSGELGRGPGPMRAGFSYVFGSFSEEGLVVTGIPVSPAGRG